MKPTISPADESLCSFRVTATHVPVSVPRSSCVACHFCRYSSCWITLMGSSSAKGARAESERNRLAADASMVGKNFRSACFAALIV